MSMYCYSCGCRLSEKDFCTNCGADVGLYKKILYAANHFYNQGLERAGVRDLTGAIISLRQCLKFNKNHVEARNLLGLVYYETGEVVLALEQWILSKNIRAEKNIADDYINMIQENPTRLQTIGQTIKKFNLALSYCHKDSVDLAIIQLKKVLSLNPNYVRAHQLLALLYIHTEDWERAKRELDKCKRIDAGNTTTLRYMKEVKTALDLQAKARGESGKRSSYSDDVVRYRSGNEDIIQPSMRRGNSTVSTIINIAIGLVIGVAGAFFLLFPARLSSMNTEAQDEIRDVSEQLDRKTGEVEELNQKISALESEKIKLQNDLDNFVGNDGTMLAVNSLLQAMCVYMQQPDNIDAVSKAVEQIDVNQAAAVESQNFQDLYKLLLEKAGPSIATTYYEAGMESYRKEMFDQAIEELSKAALYDTTNGDIYYNLANAYRKVGDDDHAKDMYKKVIDEFPDTEKARRAQNILDEMTATP